MRVTTQPNRWTIVLGCVLALATGVSTLQAGQVDELIAKENEGNTIIAVNGYSKELDCAAGGYWYETKGYRKIPGDICTGGVDLEPV